jgi:hypothetical protein
MAKSINHLIRETKPPRGKGKGVAVELRRLFVYPDGHVHLTFKDRTNWPMNKERIMKT